MLLTVGGAIDMVCAAIAQPHWGTPCARRAEASYAPRVASLHGERVEVRSGSPSDRAGDSMTPCSRTARAS